MTVPKIVEIPTREEIGALLDFCRDELSDREDVFDENEPEFAEYIVPARVAVATAEKLSAAIADLKSSVIAFLAPWAVEYQKSHGLDGLDPYHFDLLEQCGARMAGMKLATNGPMPSEARS